MNWLNSIPWLIAICGWFAAHAFSEARERRKDIKAEIEKLYERLSLIERTACSFHTKAEFDSELARTLTAQLDRLERAIDRVQILSSDLLLPSIISHRRAITLHNFDFSEFFQQKPGSELVQEITNATLEIEDEIDRQYQFRYPATFPYFRWPGFKKFIFFWR